jgi:hypothetical protein
VRFPSRPAFKKASSFPPSTRTNTGDEIVPRSSVEPFLDRMPVEDVRLIAYPGETGVALQHLAILAGREAYASHREKVKPVGLLYRAHPCESCTRYGITHQGLTVWSVAADNPCQLR